LAVNGSNPVSRLEPSQIKDVLIKKSQIGVSLAAKRIVLFRTEDITDYYTEEELGENFVNFPDKINDLIAKTPGIIAFSLISIIKSLKEKS
jgi:phosphate transport system permease protein